MTGPSDPRNGPSAEQLEAAIRQMVELQLKCAAAQGGEFRVAALWRLSDAVGACAEVEMQLIRAQMQAAQDGRN